MLVRPDHPSFPLLTSYAGLLPFGDPDQGVPVGQLFFPPYLFKQDGSRATRPVIVTSPEDISYGGHFDITVAGNPNQISSVVMLRSDHNTHSLTTGDRYVKIAFHQKGAAHKERLGSGRQNYRPRPFQEFTCCLFWTNREYQPCEPGLFAIAGFGAATSQERSFCIRGRGRSKLSLTP